MALNLANQKLVISGEFAGRDSEDLYWDLVARGAYVMKTVTKTTAALIVGERPQAKHLAGAKKHGTPLIDRAGLEALLQGATLEAVLAGEASTASPATTTDLTGWTVAVTGKFRGRTQRSIGSALAARGAKVVAKPSEACDLLAVGDDLTDDAVHALDAGVPFLRDDELDSLLSGTPIDQLVAPPTDRVEDRAAAIAAQLDGLLDELASIESGERWEDQSTLTVKPSGRAVLELRDMGGTPIHDFARRVVQRHGWPVGDQDVVVVRSVTWT